MTSYITNSYIKINMQNTIKHQKEMKINRWHGYNVRIIKDNADAVEEIKKILEKRGKS